MDNPFFDHPILNSPYEYPERHWELDDQGQPTQQIIEHRRRAEFITPIPKPKKRKGSAAQTADSSSTKARGFRPRSSSTTPPRSSMRCASMWTQWRALPNPSQWQVTPETARLLQHWRHHKFSGVRPFFCQVEAVETAIWLTEVAPQSSSGQAAARPSRRSEQGRQPGTDAARAEAGHRRRQDHGHGHADRLADHQCGAPAGSKHFTRGFLVVAPGLTIKDRLRVLQPNDPDSYYASRELVPSDMLDDVNRAKIVITNYHAFKLRERIELSKGGRSLLQGRAARS